LPHPSFQYKKRSKEEVEASVEKRANQSGGNYIGCVLDSVKLYQARKGENHIRFCPNVDPDSTHYGVDVWVHYSFGPQNATILCLLKNGKGPCPGCEARQAAEDAGDEEKAKDLKPSKRVAAYVVDRKEVDSDFPYLWLQPWTFDRDVSKAAKDRITGEYSVLDDPDDGYDVTFEKDVSGGDTFAKYIAIQVARRPTSLGGKHGDKILDYVLANPLSKVFIWRNYAELVELYSGGAATQQPAATQDNGQAAANAAARFAAPSHEDLFGPKETKNDPLASDTTANSVASSSPMTDRTASAVESTSSPSEPSPSSRPQIASRPLVNTVASVSSTATASPATSGSGPAKSRAELLREKFGAK
jgi:hypothetical protein